jgi:hypothetical protein
MPLGVLPSATWFIFAVPAIIISMSVMVVLGWWWARSHKD